jgi:hypothetical protein
MLQVDLSHHILNTRLWVSLIDLLGAAVSQKNKFVVWVEAIQGNTRLETKENGG